MFLSYVLIALNSIYGLVIMPFILGTIGESEYGVYKTIGAMTSTISVMDLGIGGTMQKYIAQFDKKENFLRHPKWVTELIKDGKWRPR